MKRAFAFFFVFALLAGLIGGVSWFQFVFKPQMIKGFIAKMAPPPQAVSVVEAKTETWVPQLPAIGTFKPYKGIDVAPQVGGIVTTLNFDSGQEVAQGAVLLTIDDSTEQADLKSGLATMKNADLALRRQQQLISGGNTSRATVDQAQATRDTAAASVERSKAIIAQKTLQAPFPGRLGIRKVDIGQYVSPGLALVTLTQLDPIYVDFPLPEQSLGAIQTGQAVEIRVDGQDTLFKGKVASVDARVSQDTRSVLVRAEVENGKKTLLPGMFANVAVLSGAPIETVTVPKTAVSYSLYGDSAFVVVPAPPKAEAGAAQAAEAGQPDLIVERRFLRTGQTRGDRIAVLDGIKAGERVVSEGQIKLQPNAHVVIDDRGGLQSRDPLPKQ
ncbi:efflux RND transporter periplasmic adaptor subunit [Lichenifustis flavocetrariae]|uniref:Efflux RND transporter periplasmic adaptor subunit n=1 Tax=Lichenifustis flavocetrariae TaxID=2949735 RepID=A0AA41YSD2_9HYPH|nr:efflux RND transporter periplasmic adaptor subunit [Lichenifustis flavocetrariae]MCW6506435.1 efflux RND transporter periplasmic adaptor subunit [Lichenifustis flavocetrariae]